MPPHTETDVHDVVTEYLDTGAKITLKGRRKRHHPGSPAPLDALPQEWRALLSRWAKRGPRCKWDTLLKDAGPLRVEAAYALLEWLLHSGWIILEEERKRGEWRPLWVDFNAPPAMRAALGLPDTEASAGQWEEYRTALEALSKDTLSPLLSALDKLHPARALTRADLVSALAYWGQEKRSGTRRDFALFARGDTKAVSDAEWRWLEENIDLGEFAIDRHTPLFLLSAHLVLTLPSGQIDLSTYPDFSALTPATVKSATSANSCVKCWRLAENRTSFERLARKREAGIGVIWLPGFPPSWWRETVAKLLALAPAPAEIACDPDPAGIEIALSSGEIWQAANLPWTPWQMDAGRLAALPRRKPLTARDMERLAATMEKPLPEILSTLAAWMRTHGEKGEQEGFL